MTDLSLPRCFDSRAQFAEWRKVNARIPYHSCRICDDCTTDYRARMRKQDRCDVTEWLQVHFGPGMKVAIKTEDDK